MIRRVHLQKKFHGQVDARSIQRTACGFNLTDHESQTGWVLLLNLDTRKRIHTLLRRYAVELDSPVNREGCSLCSDATNAPSGTSKSAAEPQKSAVSDEPKLEGSELGELRALKTA